MPEDAAPVTTDEALRAVRDAWKDALGLTDFDVDDDFFSLGGHSLLMLDVVDAIERSTDVSIPIGFFFEHPRVHALAEYVATEQGRARTPAER